MYRFVVIVLLGVVVAGCAVRGVRTEEIRGPVTWRAENFRIIQRPIVGDATRDKGDHYMFTLVLREPHGTAITFTHIAWTVDQPNTTSAASENTGRWALRPHGELRLPFSAYFYCSESVCWETGALAPVYNIILTGTDDQGQPVRVAIDLRLPLDPSPSVVRTLGFLTERPRGKVRLNAMNFGHTFDVAHDDEVVVYLSLYNDALQDPVEVTVRLYDPQGQNTQEWTHTYTMHSPGTKATYRFSPRALTQMAHQPLGTWNVRAFAEETEATYRFYPLALMQMAHQPLGTWNVQAFAEEQVIASATFALVSLAQAN